MTAPRRAHGSIAEFEIRFQLACILGLFLAGFILAWLPEVIR